MYELLLFMDELHKYLQFTLPLVIYSLLLPTPRSIRLSLTSLWLICQYILLTSLHNITQIPAQLLILSLLISPIILLNLCIKTTLPAPLSPANPPQTIIYLALCSCLTLILFFASQLLTNGCILIHLQNYLTRQFTTLEYWQQTQLFGSRVFDYNLVFGFYTFSLAGLLYYLYWLYQRIKRQPNTDILTI